MWDGLPGSVIAALNTIQSENIVFGPDGERNNSSDDPRTAGSVAAERQLLNALRTHHRFAGISAALEVIGQEHRMSKVTTGAMPIGLTAWMVGVTEPTAYGMSTHKERLTGATRFATTIAIALEPLPKYDDVVFSAMLLHGTGLLLYRIDGRPTMIRYMPTREEQYATSCPDTTPALGHMLYTDCPEATSYDELRQHGVVIANSITTANVFDVITGGFFTSSSGDRKIICVKAAPSSNRNKALLMPTIYHLAHGAGTVIYGQGGASFGSRTVATNRTPAYLLAANLEIAQELVRLTA